MKAKLEKVDNGFILETKDEKRVGMDLTDILPTIFGMCQKEIIDCAEEVGKMCWELKIEINVTPTTRDDVVCETKQVPCNESETRYEPEIGSVIEYKGEHLLCVEENSCKGCYFNDKDCGKLKMPCNGDVRRDGKSVIFVEDKKE